MTEMLEKVVAKIKQLPAKQQDAIAALILEEIEDEARWDATFTRSPGLLELLSAEAEEEDQKGLHRTVPFANSREV